MQSQRSKQDFCSKESFTPCLSCANNTLFGLLTEPEVIEIISSQLAKTFQLSLKEKTKQNRRMKVGASVFSKNQSAQSLLILQGLPLLCKQHSLMCSRAWYCSVTLFQPSLGYWNVAPALRQGEGTARALCTSLQGQRERSTGQAGVAACSGWHTGVNSTEETFPFSLPPHPNSIEM